MSKGRATWSGTIGFGLVQIPVKLFTGVREQSVGFKQLCPIHHAPIAQRKFCPGVALGAAADGATVAEAREHEVAHADLVSGFAVEQGRFVVLREEDFEAAALPLSRSVEIQRFVPEADLDCRYPQKSYVVEPDQPTSARAYALLREALRTTGTAAVGTIAIRTKQTIAEVRVMGNALILQIMAWPDELADLTKFDFPEVEISPAELALAEQLIAPRRGDVESAGFRDEYRDNLHRIIEARALGEELKFEPAAAEAATPILDLVGMLKASIEAQRAA